MNHYFVTGTDTEVGKTVACAVLTSILNAAYWKPIQSGIRDAESDQQRIKQLTLLTKERIYDSVYSLQASLSPDQAAKLESIEINMDLIHPPIIREPLIVEGAGGVWVPLNEKSCMLDLMKKLQLPVIIVARGTLGTINHTLLTIEALQKRNIKIEGIIFNGALNPDNQQAIEKWGGVKTLMHIPQFEKMTRDALQSWVKTVGLETVVDS